MRKLRRIINGGLQLQCAITECARFIKHVSERVRACVGEGGTVGRLGGDEFAIVLPEFQERAQLAELASRVLTNIGMRGA